MCPLSTPAISPFFILNSLFLIKKSPDFLAPSVFSPYICSAKRTIVDYPGELRSTLST